MGGGRRGLQGTNGNGKNIIKNTKAPTQFCGILTMEYYSPIKKKEILHFVMAWMNLESIMLSEISQS